MSYYRSFVSAWMFSETSSTSMEELTVHLLSVLALLNQFFTSFFTFGKDLVLPDPENCVNFAFLQRSQYDLHVMPEAAFKLLRLGLTVSNTRAYRLTFFHFAEKNLILCSIYPLL